VQARLQTADGYTFTARAAVALARRVLEREPPPGFQTPSRLAGAGFVLGLEGTIAEPAQGPGPPDG
jgi:short subunit dehydrogenase-like uncharacterized protein